MTFIQACELIRDIYPVSYKLIYKYRVDIPFVFKFERSCKLYDPIDIIYMHVFDRNKPDKIHGMIPRLRISTSNAVILFQLSSGVYKNKDVPLSIRESHFNAGQVFQSITGIKV